MHVLGDVLVVLVGLVAGVLSPGLLCGPLLMLYLGRGVWRLLAGALEEPRE